MVLPKKSQNLKKLGKVTKPHGLEGFFYFKLPKSLKAKDTLFLGANEEVASPVTIKALKTHKGRTLVKLSNTSDRTALEAYLGSYLWQDGAEEEESSSEENAFIGKVAKTSDGEELGVCKAFYNCGASDIIVLEGKNNLLLELPFNDTYFEKEAILQTKFPKIFFEELWQKP